MMDSRDQVILAGRLNAALLAAGLEIVSQKREGGRMTIVEAEPVSVVGWLFRGNFLLRSTRDDAGSTVLPTSHTGPTPFTPLVVIKGDGR